MATQLLLYDLPIRGTTLHVEVARENNAEQDFRPVIFTLPGGPGAGGCVLFQSHSRALEKDFQVIYWDPRGTGKSAKGDPKTYTTENYVDDIEAIRLTLQKMYGNNSAYEKIILMGASYGGMAALSWALKYKAHLKKLILIATAATHECIDTANINLSQIANSSQSDSFAAMREGSFLSEEHARQCYGQLAPLYSHSVREQQRKDPKAVSYFKLPNFGWQFSNNEFPKWMRKFNFLSRLPELDNIPVCILVAQGDWVCDPIHSVRIFENVQNPYMKLFSNCGHSIAVDANAAYIETINNFSKGSITGDFITKANIASRTSEVVTFLSGSISPHPHLLPARFAIKPE